MCRVCTKLSIQLQIPDNWNTPNSYTHGCSDINDDLVKIFKWLLFLFRDYGIFYILGKIRF